MPNTFDRMQDHGSTWPGTYSDWGVVGKRFWVPVLVGFVLLYVTLRPVANLLLHTLQVSPAVYSAVIWPLTGAALLLVAYLVVRASALSGPRSLLVAVVAVVLSCSLIALLTWSIVTLAPDAYWPYSEPASLGFMLLTSAATVLISLTVTRSSSTVSRTAHLAAQEGAPVSTS